MYLECLRGGPKPTTYKSVRETGREPDPGREPEADPVHEPEQEPRPEPDHEPSCQAADVRGVGVVKFPPGKVRAAVTVGLQVSGEEDQGAVGLGWRPPEGVRLVAGVGGGDVGVEQVGIEGGAGGEDGGVVQLVRVRDGAGAPRISGRGL
ncbi:hypothetical protein SAV31267_097050 [Streptomyces avermitilis]|uniref:Uncharacterized protein n=1 Tax=Streptomyces avermitilis TaxID=33903 RepID=A0A4D4N733_STRAX|nr:hypothetical protein SAV31267_097050 [Streptomyces avermitilis]